MLFKKIVSRLLFPVPAICEILLVGLMLLWFTRRQKAGKILVTIAALVLLFLGNSLMSAVFLRTLEDRYQPVALSSLPASVNSPQTYVVVLGSGYSPDPRIDLDSRLSDDGLIRLVEGVRLCIKLGGCRLILSGGPPAQAETMGKIAISLGIKQQDIILEKHSRDTEQEAQFIKPTVGTTPFLMVTSAAHMPRAMDLFRSLGMKPIAAPTDYLVKPGASLISDEIYPGPAGLSEATRTVYEYLGIEWEKLRGQIR